MKKLNIIGVASNFGFKAQAKIDLGVAFAPYFLQKTLLLSFSQIIHDGPDYLNELYNATLGATEHGVPLVIGGDHALAIATQQAMLQQWGDDYALIWIDAHIDANNFKTSPSGNAHGMPVATLLGMCPELEFKRNFLHLKPENLYYIGVRSFEEEEHALIKNKGIETHYIEEVQIRGLTEVFSAVIKRIRERGQKIAVSLDIDVFDPFAIPAVNTPAANGVDPESFLRFMENEFPSEQLVGFEIVEYNPLKDMDKRSFTFIQSLMKILMEYSYTGG